MQSKKVQPTRNFAFTNRIQANPTVETPAGASRAPVGLMIFVGKKVDSQSSHQGLQDVILYISVNRLQTNALHVQVFRATDKHPEAQDPTGRIPSHPYIALKICNNDDLNPALASTLQRELSVHRLLQATPHPNVLSAFSTGSKDGQTYMASELAKGQVLHRDFYSAMQGCRKPAVSCEDSASLALRTSLLPNTFKALHDVVDSAFSTLVTLVHTSKYQDHEYWSARKRAKHDDIKIGLREVVRVAFPHK